MASKEGDGGLTGIADNLSQAALTSVVCAFFRKGLVAVWTDERWLLLPHFLLLHCSLLLQEFFTLHLLSREFLRIFIIILYHIHPQGFFSLVENGSQNSLIIKSCDQFPGFSVPEREFIVRHCGQGLPIGQPREPGETLQVPLPRA